MRAQLVLNPNAKHTAATLQHRNAVHQNPQNRKTETIHNHNPRPRPTQVENQLKQKEEMGDVLHYIDFHQLQIENKQYVSRIEERNDELLKLKMTTGATVQTLNSQKEKLR